MKLILFFNIQTLIIISAILGAIGSWEWMMDSVLLNVRVLEEFAIFLAVVVNCFIFIYNIKEAKRNNWK